MLIRSIIIILLLNICSKANTQIPYEQYHNVQFKVVTLDDAIKLAKEEGKPLFIDTYAKWCIPCKKMDAVFRDRDVAQILNDNFINVKVNMDQPYGKDYQRKYGVVFLPTFLFLDKTGYPQLKVDRVITKHELINFANDALFIHYGGTPNASTSPKRSGTTRTRREAPSTTTTSRNTTPPSNTVKSPTGATVRSTTTTKPSAGIASSTRPSPNTRPSTTTRTTRPSLAQAQPQEKILQVLDADEKPPEMLYEEAYYQMQMMDESHWAVAKEYLKTQKDWSTEKNMRFIFDFVRYTDSPEFEYIIRNRKAFEKLLGADNVERSIEIIVYTRINQGIPRPDLAEAIDLFKYTSVTDPQARAYKYYIKRKHDERDSKNLLPVLNDYMRIVQKKDAKIVNLYGLYTAKSSKKKSEILAALNAMEQVVRHQPEEPVYLKTTAILHSRIGNSEQAIRAANKAISLTPPTDQESINYLREIIRSNR